MRCLYCGKELALLKRWTGGGEFCSDVHRQRYQEEYNQLALNRLLQAQVPADPKPDSKTKAEPEAPRVSPVESRPEQHRDLTAMPRVAEVARKSAASSSPAAVAIEAPPQESIEVRKTAPAPAVKPAAGERPPAPLADLFHDAFQPVKFDTPAWAPVDSVLLAVCAATLPSRPVQEPAADHGFQLDAADPVGIQPHTRVRDCEGHPREGRLEVREFVRAIPIFELNLSGRGGTPADRAFEPAVQPLPVVFPQHPPKDAAAWPGDPVREFSPWEIQLGALARLGFHATGFDKESTPAEDPSGVEAAPVEEAGGTGPGPVETSPEPDRIPEPEQKVEPAAEPSPEPVPPSVPAPTPAPVPALAQKPLPLTLHGMPAGRGKPVQIFTSLVARPVSLQAPRLNALPLRPVMVLAAAEPAAAKPAANGRPDPRTGNVKVRQPNVRVVAPPESPGKKAPVSPEPPSPEARAATAAAEPPKVEAIKIERVKVEPIKVEPIKSEPTKSEPTKSEPIKSTSIKSEPAKPEPTGIEPAKREAARVEPAKPVKLEPAKPETPKPELARPAAAASGPNRRAPLAAPVQEVDLGLPHLGMPSQPGMPAGKKIAIAAGVLVAVGAVIGFAMKGGGSGSTASAGPRIVEAGPPVTGEQGWITNFNTGEAGVRRTRDVSVLRPTMPLNDYRVAFEAQIESKAAGWVVRAADAKNFYVLKLEVVKPGLQPIVAFVRFAVINGEDQPRTQVPLTIPVRVDTMYKFRTDVVGNHMTTWVLDQKVDEWTDDRIKTGGAGLFNERGERASLKGGLSVVPLALRN